MRRMVRCGTASLKSALLNVFRAALAALLLFSCAAVGTGQTGLPAPSIPAKPILNLRLVASIGPILADGVSLIGPAAVTVNGIGEILISDSDANTIYKLSSNLELLASEGSSSSSEFVRPLGLACDAALNLYVADSGNKRIQILDRNLRFARTVDSYFDQNGSAVEFNLPSDISIDGEGNFWLADDNRIIKLDPFFNLQLEISNDTPGSFIISKVSSVRIGRGGMVAIADQGNRRLVVITTAGNYVAEIPAQAPRMVTWDKNALIWTVDSGKLSAFDINGELRFIFAGDSPASRLVWVAFDPGNRLVLLDGGLRTVSIYELVEGAAPAGEK